MALGENVGKLMAHRRLSNGEVSRGAGIPDPQTVFAMVKRKSKKSDHAAALANYFGVSLQRLMADDFDVSEADKKPGGALPSDVAMQLRVEEAEAITRLRDAIPDWRRYVISLAMLSKTKQELMLATMREAVPDSYVEQHYGDTPPVAERKAQEER